MAEKSNKELAVDVAIAYIEATSRLVYPNGGSHELPKMESINAIIQSVYSTLEKLSS